MTGTHHPLLVLQTLAGLPEPSDLRWNRPDAMLEWRGRTAAKRFGWSTWTSSRHAPPVGALSAACADVCEDYVLLMIPVDLRVRGGRPAMQTAAARLRRAGGGGTVHRG
jgi:hypothetical protein